MLARSPLFGVLRRLVRSFLRSRAAERFSPATLRNNQLALVRLLEWLESTKPRLGSLVEIDRGLLDDYAVHLSLSLTDEGSRLKAATRAGLLNSIISFFAWLERRGKLLTNPARGLALPKCPQSLPRSILSVKEVNQVLETPDLSTPLGIRNRTVLELLYSTGIRNAELRSLRLSDLDFAEKLLTVREGKGGTSRVVPMGKTAARFLLRYIEEVRPGLRRSASEDLVFLSKTGRPLAALALSVLVHRAARDAHIGKPLTPHALRHTFATHLLRGNADLRHIQALLGHRSLSSTQIYTHVAPSDLKRVHARCHPREKRR